MNEKSVKRLLLISSVIVILLAALIYELRYLTEYPFQKRKNFLIIGILSAPENFQQRLSIRETWLQLLPEMSASVYFIIGNQICQVPPYDRADPYSCVDKPFTLAENASPSTEFSTIKIQNVEPKLTNPPTNFIGFSFYIRSSITVTKLGILKELLISLNTEVQVKLISAFDNKVLASVTFDSELINETDSLVLTKAIRPVRLGTNFEGILKLETKDFANKFFPECDIAVWQNEPNVVNFIQLWHESSVIPQQFTENSCSYVFMNYTILDVENIKLYASNRTLRLNKWRESSKKLQINLNNESATYNDIFLVDIIDVYRNLSMKLTSFYKRILETDHFQYILKTDDDSFIDLLRVYEHLIQINKVISQAFVSSSKFWLWSYFKEFWKVERSGKWRENQYPSASYPTFPCGGGYVLNRGIIDYISANDHLHHFQGEDVSLGIWLSTLPVTYYRTPKVTKNSLYEFQRRIITKFKGEQYWESFKKNKTTASNLCEWTCDNVQYTDIPLCNKVQLSAPNMYAEWEGYIKKGFL